MSLFLVIDLKRFKHILFRTQTDAELNHSTHTPGAKKKKKKYNRYQIIITLTVESSADNRSSLAAAASLEEHNSFTSGKRQFVSQLPPKQLHVTQFFMKILNYFTSCTDVNFSSNSFTLSMLLFDELELSLNRLSA
jgi:hypothetical protein